MTQAKALPAASGRRKILLRVLMALIVAFPIGWSLQHAAGLTDQGAGRAGFGRGVLHGALMPLALPNLLVGNDVTIYAANNTGRAYNLGYTVGVNGCGLGFFGFFFWRLNRWRKSRG
ncbi:MAG TPA: hypothetical protein VGK40_12615 [Verrucomicrobiae bacterium]